MWHAVSRKFIVTLRAFKVKLHCCICGSLRHIEVSIHSPPPVRETRVHWQFSVTSPAITSNQTFVRLPRGQLQPASDSNFV